MAANATFGARQRCAMQSRICYAEVSARFRVASWGRMLNSLASAAVTPRGLVAEFLQNSTSTAVESSSALLRLILRPLSRNLEQAELNSLVAYAMHSAAIDCPVLPTRWDSSEADSALAAWRRCMVKYDGAQAAALMQVFWNALVGTLSTLIGEHLTLLQFRQAMQSSTPGTDPAS